MNHVSSWPRPLLACIYCIALVVGCSDAAGEPSTAPGREDSATTAAPQADAESSAIPANRQWSQWRGPGTRSVAYDAELPPAWPPEAPLRSAWTAELGTGWSSPVVADGRVFITDRVGDEERIQAFSVDDGELLWRQSHPVDFEPHAVGRRHGAGPKSTPLVHGGRVYALGIAGFLECRDRATGELVWSLSLPQRFGAHEPLPSGRAFVRGEQCVVVPVGDGKGAPVPLFGYTGSPTLADGRLVLSVGGERGGTIMAFDAATGEVVWKALDENVSYSSPVVATLAGERQVVVMTGPRVVGLRLTDGKLLWSWPFQIQYDESISTPAVAERQGLALVTGQGRPLTALRIERNGDTFQATKAWTNDELSSYLSSMLVHDGHVYGMNDGGEFACLRLSDGESTWIDGSFGFYCSPVLVGDRLLCLNERGELIVVDADPARYADRGPAVVAESATWTVPAIDGRRLLVRSGDRLVCCELAPQGD